MTARPAGLAAGSAVVGMALTGAWLWGGPPIADGLVSGVEGGGGEALFNGVVFAPLLLLAVVGAWIVDIPALRAGSLRFGALGLALGSGGVLLATGYGFLADTARLGSEGGAGAALLLGLLVIALQVLAEEALFRGWFQPALARLIGGPAAVAMVAAAFAGFHFVAGAHGLLALLNLFLGGVLFGVLALRSGGILGAFAAHLGWNASEQLLLGLDPNPGVGGFGAILDLDLAGAPLWGGSELGLNASAAMSFALLSLIVPLLLWRVSSWPPVPHRSDRAASGMPPAPFR